MKKIILNDRLGKMIDFVLKNTDYIIQVLVVDDIKDEYKSNERIIEVCRPWDIGFKVDISYLNYDLIQTYRDAQIKIENAINRYCDDYQLRKSIYYNSLSYWNKIFLENNIYAVILDGQLHGEPADYIPYTMAIRNNIKCYSIELVAAWQRGIFNEQSREFVKTIQINHKNNINSSKYYTQISNKKADEKNLMCINGFIKRSIAKIIYKNFGYLILEFFIKLKILFKPERYWQGDSDRKYLQDILFRKYLFKLKEIIKIKRNYSYYIKLAQEPNFDENYIIYSLHFEPEAVTLARNVLESQLIIIQMLSEALPNGWKLYVKEHPHQYKINDSVYNGHVVTMRRFKSKKFYDCMNSFKNVKLIVDNYPMKKLMKNSKGIATIVGTVALEAMDLQKPILIFGGERTPLKYCKDIFNITSYDECARAIEMINDGYRPDYDDFSKIVDTYYYSETEYENILKHLFLICLSESQDG